MGKKVIAIGNRLMMDDAVSVMILEKIKNELEDKNIETIVGETDVDFCFSKLNQQDIFYIIDSTYYGNVPGTVTFKKLKDIKNTSGYCRSIHSLGLMELVNIYKMDIKGYFIGIEIANIDINIGLSHMLQGEIDYISRDILNFII
ncbi:hydrogenase maturation protease [Clostridium tagluense]|uniref:hydrogenase maturation protease n=1 Tax=Clostridium TaxID=1485 RepID=UPI0013E90F36|nr:MULTISPECIES: hydrogenase maturation protease [Clostridium]MBU3127542.1 hydrogenase maturation protease [Clostridium tagluense]MBW9156760.1 hydrogenase maturation protease [Clostridium tagluense]MBZ9621930.1 hydrogenase maturation protease [Clostridium sp. FP2]MCB2297447.1 hydrogenase maturation protease [Clostridium tagluense]MCB2314033.1 hydrogenase maturation protease [Clostridium tagluense]